MQYIFLPVLLLAYFEILGQAVSLHLNVRVFSFSFPLGMLVLLGSLYVLYFPIIMFRGSFWIAFVVTILFFICSLGLIAKQYKKLRFNLDTRLFIFLILFVIQIVLEANHASGNYYAADTLTYANYISGNIRNPHLYSFLPDSGLVALPNPVYSFQSFYTFASVILYPFHFVFNHFGVRYYYLSSYIWVYSILFYALKLAVMENIFDALKINNNCLKIVSYVFWIGFYGLLYWNLELAFIGNVWRMMICCYILIYVQLYLETNKNSYLVLCIFAMWACVAVASNNALLVCLFSYVLYITKVRERQGLLKYLVIGFSLPVFNLVYVLLSFEQSDLALFLCIVLATLFAGIFVFEKKIDFIFLKLKMPWVLTSVIGMMLIVFSYLVTGNIFDISGFTNTLSWVKDMTFDYTMINPWYFLLANVFFWTIVVFEISTLFDSAKNLLFPLGLMVIVFFNPLVSSFWNATNEVYYRSYDIFINPYTFILVFSLLLTKLKKKTTKTVFSMVLVCTSFIIGFFMYINRPSKEEYVASDNYHWAHRLTNEEIEAIDYFVEYTRNNDISDGKVITSIQPLKSEASWIQPLFGRFKSINTEEVELGKIFYPVEYYGDPATPENADYWNMYSYIVEGDYSFIIQDKDVTIFNEIDQQYYPLTWIIDQCGFNCIYENFNYKIYSCK